MALQAQAQAQASPSPSPSPSPARETGRGEWPATAISAAEKLPTAASAGAGASGDGDTVELVVVASTHHAAAAKYVPPRSESRTADPNSSGWYSWSGGRPAQPRHTRPDPPLRAPPRRQQQRAEPPPRSQPPAERPPPAPVPAFAPSPAPAHVPPPVPASAPAPVTRAPPPSHAQVRSADGVVPAILSRKRRVAAMQRTALLARGAAAGLCLAALAVLAADTRKGWARDSYGNYTQFRYSEAVNVIGFIYSVFQFAALVDLMRRKKHLIAHPKRDLFDFSMDQVLTYLLISSSSSATARVSDLIDNWGSDPFPSMANGSIAISFMAFAVFAICSLISAYNLFRRDM